jgi:hypothetical protein
MKEEGEEDESLRIQKKSPRAKYIIFFHGFLLGFYPFYLHPCVLFKLLVLLLFPFLL